MILSWVTSRQVTPIRTWLIPRWFAGLEEVTDKHKALFTRRPYLAGNPGDEHHHPGTRAVRSATCSPTRRRRPIAPSIGWPHSGKAREPPGRITQTQLLA